MLKKIIDAFLKLLLSSKSDIHSLSNSEHRNNGQHERVTKRRTTELVNQLTISNLVTLYSEPFSPFQYSTISPLCWRKTLLNEMVVLNHFTAEKGKRSETKRKAIKDMQREDESVCLPSKRSTSTKLLVHLHITRRFLTPKWTGCPLRHPFIPEKKSFHLLEKYLLRQNISWRFLRVKQ